MTTLRYSFDDQEHRLEDKPVTQVLKYRERKEIETERQRDRGGCVREKGTERESLCECVSEPERERKRERERERQRQREI